MLDSDSSAFLEAWATACEMTGNGKVPSPRAMNMAFDVLKDFDLENVLKALSAHVRNPQTGQFQPKPADIVRHLHGTQDDAAMEAWAKVDHAIRRVGTGPHLVFDDPKIHVVITEMGGLQKLGSVDEREFSFLSREFCKRYASIRNVENYPPRLSGYFTSGAVEYVGDPQRAKQVENSGNVNRFQISSPEQVATALVEDLSGAKP